MKSKFIFIYVTCPTGAVADRISTKLIAKKLVACANIISGMQSLYRWQKRVHRDREIVLILKTRRTHFRAVEREIKILHPYECPCVVALPIVAASSSYLKWLTSET